MSLFLLPTTPGLAFDILPPLRLGIGIGDERWNIHIIREILHPPRRRAGFKNNTLNVILRKLQSKRLRVGGDGSELRFAGARAIFAEYGLVLAEIDGENVAV
jgi:hypothetical protein